MFRMWLVQMPVSPLPGASAFASRDCVCEVAAPHSATTDFDERQLKAVFFLNSSFVVFIKDLS